MPPALARSASSTLNGRPNFPLKQRGLQRTWRCSEFWRHLRVGPRLHDEARRGQGLLELRGATDTMPPAATSPFFVSYFASRRIARWSPSFTRHAVLRQTSHIRSITLIHHFRGREQSMPKCHALANAREGRASGSCWRQPHVQSASAATAPVSPLGGCLGWHASASTQNSTGCLVLRIANLPILAVRLFPFIVLARSRSAPRDDDLCGAWD
jgi:hypothetical protein